jgi:hypothetical protein
LFAKQEISFFGEKSDPQVAPHFVNRTPRRRAKNDEAPK